jgi:hypothetical protein
MSVTRRVQAYKALRPLVQRHVGMSEPPHHVIEASELVDGIGERLWRWTNLVEKLSAYRVRARVPELHARAVSDHVAS